MARVTVFRSLFFFMADWRCCLLLTTSHTFFHPYPRVCVLTVSNLAVKYFTSTPTCGRGGAGGSAEDAPSA